MHTVALSDTPSALRLTIGVFGRVNSGKSSLINALAGQAVSLVSETGGTTTDPVSKPIEIYPLGPCVLIDTAGFGDESTLGALRQKRTEAVMDKTDLAILVFGPNQTDFSEEQMILETLKARQIPVVAALNKSELLADPEEALKQIQQTLSLQAIAVSAAQKTGLSSLREALVKHAPADFENVSIVGHLVRENDRVLLVMPQDLQAPKGRLILPQVQVIRDLLDHGAVVTCVTAGQIKEALADQTPHLIITDSQVFPLVHELKPDKTALTSFSVLMARYKGDIEVFVRSAKQAKRLKAGDRVLIAEACSHAPLDGDIGRIKIPNLIHQKIDENIQVEVAAGSDFPDDLTPYALIIHCGGCMFGRRQILSRVMRAVSAGVPITNYGIFLAEMAGILDQITW